MVNASKRMKGTNARGTAKARTPKQMEASRVNGSRSRGPNTPAGKAISRMNALKHGLLARTISPASDFRGDDKVYQELLRELMSEFQPTSFTQSAEIEQLASLYLQRARTSRYLEEAQAPRGITAEDSVKVVEASEIRREQGILDRVIATIRSGTSGPASPPEEAEIVGQWAVDVVRNMQAYIAGPAADEEDGEEEAAGHAGNASSPIPPGAPPADLESPAFGPKQYADDDDPVLVEYRELESLLGTSALQFGNQRWVSGLLSCPDPLSENDRNRLLGILSLRRGWTTFRLYPRAEAEARVANALRHVARSCYSPKKLMSLESLQRYQTKFSRSIERILARLAKRNR